MAAAVLETLSSQSKKDNPSPLVAKGSYGRAYLQKMVQLQFDLPPENLASVRLILTTRINTSAKPRNESASHNSEENKRSREARPEKTDNVTLLRRASPWFAGITVTVAIGVAVNAWFTPVSANTNNSSQISSLTVIAILVGASGVVTALIPVLLNRRRRRAQRIDEQIKSLSTETDNVDSLKAAVLESDAARQGGFGLAGQRLAQFIADDSTLR